MVGKTEGGGREKATVKTYINHLLISRPDRSISPHPPPLPLPSPHTHTPRALFPVPGLTIFLHLRHPTKPFGRLQLNNKKEQKKRESVKEKKVWITAPKNAAASELWTDTHTFPLHLFLDLLRLRKNGVTLYPPLLCRAAGITRGSRGRRGSSGR